MREKTIDGTLTEVYLSGMRAYAASLKAQSTSDKNAVREAKNALIRTGVLTKKGAPKKQIVASWE